MYIPDNMIRIILSHFKIDKVIVDDSRFETYISEPSTREAGVTHRQYRHTEEPIIHGKFYVIDGDLWMAFNINRAHTKIQLYCTKGHHLHKFNHCIICRLPDDYCVCTQFGYD